MGQKGRDRGSRRREFDDDAFVARDPRDESPPRSSRRTPRQDDAPSGPAIDGTAKWFNTEKGFGFVELADGSGDVFLHIAVLETAGHESVDPGAKLSVQVGVGPKGRQVTAVLSIEAGAATPPRAKVHSSPRQSTGRERPDPATATTVEGTVKWYNAQKGFGFVVCEDGERDVFVHASVIERAGLRGLDEGQRLAMKVVKTPKGREAISLALLG